MQTREESLLETLSWVSTGIVVVAAALSGIAILKQTDGYAQVFVDMRIRMPALTVFVIANQYLIAGFFGLAAVGAVTKEILIADRLKTLIINGVVLGAVAAVMFACILAVRMPINGLINGGP